MPPTAVGPGKFLQLWCVAPGLNRVTNHFNAALIMTTQLVSTFRAAILAGACSAAAMLAGEKTPAGYVDLGQFTPSAKGEFVEVNLQPCLLKLVAAVAACKDPEAANLIRGLQHVRVNVVKLDDTNRGPTTERMAAIREKLSAQGWTAAVTVRDEKGENVDVHVKTRNDEVVEGLVITVLGKKNEAVFVNIVGDIRPEQVAKVAEHLKIDGLRKLDLKAKPASKAGA
jgi:hypothetical protein